MQRVAGNTIKISELLSVCVQLAHQACKIVHSVQESGKKGTVMKGHDDPVTVADIKAQTLIVKGLRRFWPQITIVGEEDVEFQGDLGFDVAQLNPKLVTEGDIVAINGKALPELDEKDTVVWVDPLDATLSFTRNELDAVTTLIGVSYQKKPALGVIAQPYPLSESYLQQGAVAEKRVYKFDPRVYFGGPAAARENFVCVTTHAELGEEYAGKTVPLKRLQRPPVPAPEIVCHASKNHNTPEKLDLLRSLPHARIAQTGGAGKKQLDLITGESTYYCYIGKGTKRWDTCAGDALTLAFGGVSGGLNGETYAYDAQAAPYWNDKGIMGTLDRDLWEQLVKKTREFPAL